MLELKANQKTNNSCPICGNPGQQVKRITVECQVKNNMTLNREQFFLCRTPECQVAYFTEGGTVINQEELKSKIWFKKSIPSPIPICYCSNVTKEEIFYHVTEMQCCSTLDDIKRHTGANTGCDCLTKNPAGV